MGDFKNRCKGTKKFWNMQIFWGRKMKKKGFLSEYYSDQYEEESFRSQKSIGFSTPWNTKKNIVG
jgi:hypothetical protein